ncbi:MAG: phytanoyl-CoA dioxygenase family protein [Alphaproteobacteria bacterium]
MQAESMLTRHQIEQYREAGYLVVEDLLTPEQLSELRRVTYDLVAGARGLTRSDKVYDLEDSHRPEAPRVRRIKKPHRLDDLYWQTVRAPNVAAILTQIIGPNVRLNSSKINLKAPGYGAAVEWHQDWAFYPSTNQNILALGVMLDDVDEANGPMLVLPGSHRGPIHSHHDADGFFCGAIDPTRGELDFTRAEMVMGRAGSVSVHHVRLVHGSALNTSARPRAMLLYEARAADAWPLMGVGDLDEFNALMICGQPMEPRLEPVPVRMPVPVRGEPGSIYDYQSAAERRYFDVYRGE